jgi:hypothetical protein
LTAVVILLVLATLSAQEKPSFGSPKAAVLLMPDGARNGHARI